MNEHERMNEYELAVYMTRQFGPLKKLTCSVIDSASTTEKKRRWWKDFQRDIDAMYISDVKTRIAAMMVDPHLKKNILAALAVAKYRHPSVADQLASSNFESLLQKTIEQEVEKGRSRVANDIADLSSRPKLPSRQFVCLAALVFFHEENCRWPTKAEFRTFGAAEFPDFLSMDEKEWRRLRGSLDLEWLEDGPPGRPKKGGH